MNDLVQDTIMKLREDCILLSPIVSIHCTTYNHEKYIRDTLEGFVMQKTNFPFVAIVHDDASSDGTADIIREYAAKYPKIIKGIYETENQYSKRDGSLRHILDEACRATGSKYIAMCEGDDYWTDPLKLQKQIDVLETHSECTIALSSVLMVNRDRHTLNVTIPKNCHLKEGIVTLQDLINEEFYGGNWAFHTSSFVFRSYLNSIYVKNKTSIFEKFPYGDMPLLLTCLLNGNGYFVADITGCYRVMSGGYNSSMAANPEIAAKNYLMVANALEDFNNHTKYKFNKQLNRAIARYHFKAEMATSKGFNIKLLSWRYRPFYIYLIKILIQSISPIFYNKIKCVMKHG